LGRFERKIGSPELEDRSLELVQIGCALQILLDSVQAKQHSFYSTGIMLRDDNMFPCGFM